MAKASVSRPPPRRTPVDIEVRYSLFEAAGVIECVRRAVASKFGPPDEMAIFNGLSVASRIIDDVAGKLEPQQKGRRAEEAS